MAEDVGEQPPLEGSAEPMVQDEPAPAAPTRQTVLQWVESLQAGAGLYPGVELLDHPVKGHSLRVKPMLGASVEKGTAVGICPVSATLSYMNLQRDRTGLPHHSFVYDSKFLETVDREVAAAFLLMDQFLKGDESFWAPYIQSLPAPSSLMTTQHYYGEDLQWLQGTSLELSRDIQLKSWRSKYEQGLIILRSASNPAVSSYTWGRFLWAMTIFSSRGFSSKVLTGVDMTLSVDGAFSVLVPLLDLANHDPQSKVEWYAGEDIVSLRVLEDVQPGAEIHNNYGPKNNASLMVCYGFCMGDNPYDCRSVNLKAVPGSFLFDLRFEQKRRFPNQDESELGTQYHIFSIFYPLGDQSIGTEASIFSRDLLDAVAVCAANTREIKTIQMEPGRLYLPRTEYGASRSVLNGLGQVQLELLSQALKSRADGFLDKTPQNKKQQLAKLYREAQLMHIENAIALTTWTLYRATVIVPRPSNETFLDQVLSRVPEEKFGLRVRDRLRSRIRDRNSIVEHDGELLKGEAVVTTLPSTAAQRVQGFLRRVLKEVTPVFEESQLPVSVDMVTYCIFTRFCVAAYRHLPQDRRSSYLGPRIKRWILFILHNYPEPAVGQEWMVEDSDVDYLLTEIHRSLQLLRGNHPEIFEPVEALTGPWLDNGWLSRESFRWAWYTAEDEIVQVPKKALEYIAQPGTDLPFQDLSEALGDWYLYIPHDDIEAEE